MNEKNVSILIFVFVLLVAIPGTVFLFSERSTMTGGPQYAPIYEGSRGVDIPIYEGKEVVGFEKRGHTAAGRAYEPGFYETYSAQMNMDCPPGYLSLTQRQATNYIKAGKNIEKFGFNYCLASLT